jgi:IS30 family transposase
LLHDVRLDVIFLATWIAAQVDRGQDRPVDQVIPLRLAHAREIEDRAVPRHWEGDLLTGANDTHVATLVERNTRFTMLVKIPRKDTSTVVAALAEHIRKLPEELRRSLTWDQGKEMHAHKRFTVATNVQVYFCDPRSPWQRGSNENTNGLLRQCFPRATDFSRISQRDLNAIALRLNQRPRKTLGFETPADRLHRCCTDRLNPPRESGHRATPSTKTD